MSPRPGFTIRPTHRRRHAALRRRLDICRRWWIALWTICFGATGDSLLLRKPDILGVALCTSHRAREDAHGRPIIGPYSGLDRELRGRGSSTGSLTVVYRGGQHSGYHGNVVGALPNAPQAASRLIEALDEETALDRAYGLCQSSWSRRRRCRPFAARAAIPSVSPGRIHRPRGRRPGSQGSISTRRVGRRQRLLSAHTGWACFHLCRGIDRASGALCLRGP